MKQVLVNSYPFNPSAKTVDLSTIFGFNPSRLFAIINISKSQIIYATGIAGYGFTNITGNVVTLDFDTTSQNSSDILQVVYDTINTDIANAFVTKNTDGVNSQAYTAAGEAKVIATPLTNSSIVKAQLQDNTGAPIVLGQATSAFSLPMVIASNQSPIPVAQSGTWTTGRTWDLSNSTDSVAAVQSGTWNINNIVGTISLPTGASTAGLQTTGNTTLASILTALSDGTQEVQVTNFPAIQPVSQSGIWTTARSWDLSNITDSVAAVQSGTWNIANITGTVVLPTGAATSALQSTINTTLTSILNNQTNGSQEVQVTNFPAIQAVSQSGSWTVNLAAGSIDIGKVDQGAPNTNGASWWMQIGDSVHGPVSVKPSGTAAIIADPALVTAFSPNSPLPAGSAVIGSVAQSGTWNVTNISGTVSLPTGAATAANQATANSSLASILANQTNGTQETQVTNFPAIQPVSQSGTWTVNLAGGSIDIGDVNQGNPGTNANAWWMQIGDTTHGPVAVKAASIAALAADPSLVVAFSPNSPLPAGSAVIGSVAQSGTWNVTNISGTVSLPTGAATSALQTTGNTALASILANQTNGTQETQVTNFPSVQAVSQSGAWNITNITGTVSLPTGAATSALQGTANTALASILANQTNGTQEVQVTNYPPVQAVSQNGTWNINNIAGTVSLPTGASTSALQGSANTTLSAILLAQTNGTQETQVTNFPAIQAVSQSGSWTVALATGSIEIGKVDQGAPATLPNAWATKITDGTNGPVAVKAASTAALAADPSFVTAFSPNSPLPTGANVIGSVAQSGAWNITNISGTVSLPTGAATSALQTTGNTSLASILANQTNGTQETQVTNFPAVQSVSQNGTWNLNNITGTVSLPTGAATSALQTTGNTSLASILANQTNGTQETQVTNFPAIQAVSQSGTWTVALAAGSIDIGKVDQGLSGTNANAWWTQIGDTTHGPVAVKAASIAALATDPSFVVAFSPNSPLPAGSAVIGSVAQSGTWNVTNISGTVSLPTGAATSALQTTGNTALASILANQTNGTQTVAQAGAWNITNITGTVSLPTGAATAALQGTGNTSLASILANQTNGTQETQVTNFPATQAVTQSGTWTTGRTWALASAGDSVSAIQSGAWNITNITGTIALPTGASTSALQTTGNTTLASILADMTNGTQLAQMVDAAGHVITIKAASVAALATDTSLVTAFSPNSPLPTGANVIGSVAQSGTWNVTNISGTVSLPTGASTSALQTTGNTSLASILANQTNGTQTVGQAGAWNITNITGTVSLPTGAATSALQTTGNTSLASILANQTNGTQTVGQAGTWNITNISGTVSLPTGASTAALQSTGNTALASILSASTNGTSVAQAADAAGHIITIKPASTTPVPTDTVLVVGNSPNKATLAPAGPAAASVGVASAQVLAANATRSGCVLMNNSVNIIYFGLGVAAVVGSGITLLPGGSWEMDEFTLYNGVVNAIASAAASNLSIQEFNA